MDNKEYWQKTIDELAHINRTLDKFLKIANGRPGKQNTQAKEDEHTVHDESESARRELFANLHLGPPPKHHPDSRSKWYNSTQWWKSKTFEWWKARIEVLAFIFAMGYAVITFFQWYDLRQNFFIEQKSWAKYQVLWPVNPTAEPRVGVSITNTGKIPMLFSEVFGYIEVIPDDKPALIPDGNHPAAIDKRSFLFPNDNYVYVANLYDEKSGKIRGFSDSELSELIAGNSYIAIFGIIKYKDELGDHWLRFCDWHNYSQNAISNALDCVSMNRSGDGKIPKAKPLDHADPWQD